MVLPPDYFCCLLAVGPAAEKQKELADKNKALIKAFNCFVLLLALWIEETFWMRAAERRMERAYFAVKFLAVKCHWSAALLPGWEAPSRKGKV
jgi:hypothetical protein